jgi:hypothetical protein
MSFILFARLDLQGVSGAKSYKRLGRGETRDGKELQQ